jgi:hypothetical protein
MNETVDNTEQLNNNSNVSGEGAAPPAAATTTSDSAPDTTGESSADTQEGQKPDAAIQKRINRLTRQRGEAERRADRLAADFDALRREMAELKQAKSAQVDPKDFPNYDAYVEAKARTEAKAAARQEIEASNRTRTEQETIQHLQSVHETFVEKATEQAEEAGIDLDAALETLRAQPNLSVLVMERLAESEHSARLAEYLAENPQELDRVSRLGPQLATRALDKIEAGFRPKSGSARTSTNAPAPPKTVGGRAVMQADPAKQTIEEYSVAWQERQKKQAEFG